MASLGALAFLLFISCFRPVLAAEVSIEARIEPTRFTLDQEALLSLTIVGQRNAQPELPTVDGLSFIPMGRSTQIQWINGSMSSSLTLTYRVRASKTGRFTIGPIKIQGGSQTAASKTIQIEVMPAGAGTGGTPVPPPPGRADPASADQAGQVMITADKQEIFAGELLPITITGYFRRDMRITIQGKPQLTGNGFILEAIDEEPLQEEVTHNGMASIRLTWHGTVSAIRAGTLPLQVALPATVLIPEQRRMVSPFFNDPFFDLDNFFTSYRKKEITLQSKPLQIRVLPLPETGRPDDFSGAIGSFSLQTKAQPTVVSPGDPITLTMTVSGTGNFDRVSAPVFTGSPTDWKIYPPSRGKMTETADQAAAGGTKEKEKRFEQAIVPLHDNIREIPGVRFSFFDPDKGHYVTLQSTPIQLRMQPGSGQPRATLPTASNVTLNRNPQPGGSGQQQATQPGLALAPLHTELGHTIRELHLLYRQTWFLVMMAVLACLFFLALLLLWRHRQHAANPDAAAQILYNRQVAELISQAQEAMAKGDSARFFTLIRQTIQLFCSHDWQCEARAITAADVAARLGETSPLAAVLKRVEHALYEQREPERDAMEEILATVEQEVRQR